MLAGFPLVLVDAVRGPAHPELCTWHGFGSQICLRGIGDAVQFRILIEVSGIQEDKGVGRSRRDVGYATESRSWRCLAVGVGRKGQNGNSAVDALEYVDGRRPEG